MSAKQFREGDIVRVTHLASAWANREGCVDSVDGDGHPIVFIEHHRLMFSDWAVTLLRRPVRAGDKLRAGCGPLLEDHWATFLRFEEDRAVYRMEPHGYESSDWIEFGFRERLHLDGTPIEPPLTTAEPAPAPTMCSRCSRVGPRVDSLCLGCFEATRVGRANCSRCGCLFPPERARGGTQLPGQTFCSEKCWCEAKEGLRADGADGADTKTTFTQVFVDAISLANLARAIFETDPRVVAFVEHVAETTRPPMPPPYTTENHAAWQEHSRRMNRGFATAWARDENGWRTEATARAKQILDALAAPGAGPGL